jgi:hypothetical protein
MPFHKQGAYDAFDSIAEAKRHYKRCRTNKSFILRTVRKAKCDRCGNLLSEKPADEPNLPDNYDGNRCEYHAKTKSVSAFHYDCSWKGIMDDVVHLADKMGA